MATVRERLAQKREELGAQPGGLAGGAFQPPVQTPSALGEGGSASVRERLATVRAEGEGSPPIAADPTGAALGTAFGGQTIGELITGKARREKLPEELQDAPELIEAAFTKEFAQNVPIGQQLKTVAGLLLAVDPKSQIDVIKKQIPEAQISTDSQGVTSVAIGDEPFLLNAPGISGQDRAQLIAQGLAFLSPAKIAGIGKTLLSRVLLSAPLSALTSGRIDIAAAQLGAEEGVSVPRAVGAGVLGPVAEALPAAASGIRNVRQARRLGVERAALEEVEPAIAAAREAGEAVDIGLFRGQKLGRARELREQEFIAQQSTAAQKASQALLKQNEEADAAVLRLLDEISPQKAVEGAAGKVRSIAQLKRQSLVDAREEVASPIYKRAFAEAKEAGTRVDVTPVLKKIDELMQTEFVIGPVHKALRQARQTIALSAKVEGSNLKALHGARRTLWDEITKARGSQAGTTQTVIGDARRGLTKLMKDASGAYDDAREAFKQASPAIEQFDANIFGKVAKLEDLNLERVRKLIFKNRSTQAAAKKLINEVDDSGATWNAILRDEAESRLSPQTISGLQEETKTVLGIKNVPSRLNRLLFGEGEKRRVFLAALPDDEMRKNALFLEEALGRASLGRSIGSPTDVFGDIRRRLEGTPRAIMRWVASPIKGTAEAGGATIFDRRVRAYADVLFDPKWEPQLSKVRALRNKPKESEKAMTQLLRLVGQSIKEEGPAIAKAAAQLPTRVNKSLEPEEAEE